MWTLVGIILVSGLCAAIEWPSIKGHKKEQVVFWILLVLGTALCIGYALKLPRPTPLELIAILFKPIGYWLHNTLPPAK
ncbi:hypothetical protein [Paenibacillus sp. OV219]|uniref:hypothetical protein n=1 Tax=Paenibacillus sp. OV219 TaxID=1884377 RepID=UPI0008BE7052|nr:hypothetical protein [Paenibacillus sp. OV219]SEO01321.1 hypothetical protein SAMN05518847_105249 [Paenibacillus sp. OV219]